MARFTARFVLASLVAWMALPAGARADDTDLFAKGNVPPNVLIILDTSQSMTWFNNNGATVGDEFPGAGTQGASRMWLAKSVLSGVVTQFSNQINFGLASYNQGDASTNAAVLTSSTSSPTGAPMSWYYSTGSSLIPFDGWLAYPSGAINTAPKYYFWPHKFDLRVPKAGLGGPADATDPGGYNPATLKPNNPSFTLTWALRSAGSGLSPVPTNPVSSTPSNPWKQKLAGQAASGGTTTTQNYCQYQWLRSPDNVTWTFYGSTWTTSTTGCPAAGTTDTQTYTAAVTVTNTCTFVKKLTIDTSQPYQYSCQQYTNGSPTGSPWTTFYQDDQGASVTTTVSTTAAYYQERYSYGVVSITTTSGGTAYRPDQYRWWYYYEATCKTNCNNTGKFWQWYWVSPWYVGDSAAPSNGWTDCQADRVTDPYVDPPTLGLSNSCSAWRNASNQIVFVPYPQGQGNTPLDATYNFQGNNYNLGTDTSCTDPNNGATVLVDVGSGTQADIQSYLGTGADPTKELHAANTSTPIAGSLATALTYFTNPDGVVQTDAYKQCRKNFVILVTDGGEACLINLTVPGQKAKDLANLDNPAGGVKTYVVGLDQGGLSNNEKTVLDDVATSGGTFQYYSASNATALNAALNAILGEILSQNYSFASIIVPRMRFKDNLIAVQAAMLPNVPPDPTKHVPFWKGFLTAYKLQDDGTLPTDANHLLDPTKVVIYWEAADMLDKRTDPRTMHTSIKPEGGSWQRVPFIVGTPANSTANTNLYRAIGCQGDGTAGNPNFPDVDGDGHSTTADCPVFVNLLRGSNLFNWGSKLGDIFHSQPVVVGAPSPTFVDTTFDPNTPAVNLSLNVAPSTYDAFRNNTTNSTRTRIVVVGANDGFLHAFNAGSWDSTLGAYDTGTGAEVWAYSPPQVSNSTWVSQNNKWSLIPASIANLGIKNGAHTYFVDGTARVADVWLDDNNDGAKAPDGSEWHTVLLMNLRQGGTGIFHLDITNPTNPQPIGIASGALPYYPTCGQSWSEPAIGKVKLQIGSKKVDRWVAFFGDGDTSALTGTITSSCGKRFYAIDLKTGGLLWYLYLNSGGGGSGDETRFMSYDMAGPPMALDTNGDGYVDRVYIGDRGGQIWRLNVSALGTNNGGDVVPGTGTASGSVSVSGPWLAAPSGSCNTNINVASTYGSCMGGNRVTNWVVSRLFAGPTSQMFYMKSAAALDTAGNLWIFAGTGNRAVPLQLDTPADAQGKGTSGRLYGIKDAYISGSPAPAPWTAADLTDVTGTNTLDPAALSGPGGWMVKLDLGEKNFTATEVFNKVVYFSTEVPQQATSSTGCSTNPTTARLYMMYYLTGGGITDVAAFTAATPTPSARYVDLGAGAPIRTVISTLALGSGAVLVTGNSQQGIYFGTGSGARDFKFSIPSKNTYTQYWRVN